MNYNIRLISRFSKSRYSCFSLSEMSYCSKPKVTTENISIKGDIVGPPNPVSNIRPITFHIPQNETTLEKNFRIKRENVQNWHEEFWMDHNAKFIKERKQFEIKIKNSRPGRSNQLPLTADEMSIFYKSFLDKYWKHHFRYNIEWYKKNISLLSLALRIEISRLKNGFK